MKTTGLHRMFGLIGVAVLLGAVAFVAYGDVKDGTDRADVLTDPSTDDTTIEALGGDDTIKLDASTDGNNDNDNDTVFAGPGNDSVLTGAVDDDATIFGQNGDDTFRLDSDATVPASGPTYTGSGGRGDDFFNVIGRITDDSSLKDGPGHDTFIDQNTDATPANDPEYTVRLLADNTQDTVIFTDGGPELTIELAKGSGRDVIQCSDVDSTDPNVEEGGTVFLNGNRKATDTMGNNLREAALLGGTAESGCDRIIP